MHKKVPYAQTTSFSSWLEYLSPQLKLSTINTKFRMIDLGVSLLDDGH